jgi:hypothetical protein
MVVKFAQMQNPEVMKQMKQQELDAVHRQHQRQVYAIQMREELVAIDKINNIDGLLSFSEVKHQMKPKALVALLGKIAFLQS